MTQAQRCEVAAWVLAAAGLLGVLHLHLLAALLAGLLVFELVETAAARLRLAAGQVSTNGWSVTEALWREAPWKCPRRRADGGCGRRRAG